MSNYVKLAKTWSDQHNRKLQQINPSNINFCMCNPDSCSVAPHGGGCKQGDYNSECMFACENAAAGSLMIPRDCVAGEDCPNTAPGTAPGTVRCRPREGGTQPFPGPDDFTCMTQCNGDTLCYRVTESPCCTSDTDCSYLPGSYCNNGSCHGAPMACPKF